jgi:hypothetical protein
MRLHTRVQSWIWFRTIYTIVAAFLLAIQGYQECYTQRRTNDPSEVNSFIRHFLMAPAYIAVLIVQAVHPSSHPRVIRPSFSGVVHHNVCLHIREWLDRPDQDAPSYIRRPPAQRRLSRHRPNLYTQRFEALPDLLHLSLYSILCSNEYFQIHIGFLKDRCCIAFLFIYILLTYTIRYRCGE